MRLLAATLSLVLIAGQAVAQTPAPDPCVASPEEVALAKGTTLRMQRRPDLSPLFRQAHIAEGCGVWRVTVTSKGAVDKLELIRGQGRPDYERLLRPLLMKATFQPSEVEWIGMLRIIIKQPD